MYAFYITGQVVRVLKVLFLQVTATSFVISAHLDDCKAIEMYTNEAVETHTKQPFKEHLLHYQLSKPS